MGLGDVPLRDLVFPYQPIRLYWAWYSYLEKRKIFRKLQSQKWAAHSPGFLCKEAPNSGSL